LYLHESQHPGGFNMPYETTPVVFRRWRDAGTVIALFPGIPTDTHGQFCEAYEHVGQHGGADYHAVIRATTPADDQTSAPLASELVGIGYDLKPVRRASRKLHEARRASARA